MAARIARTSSLFRAVTARPLHQSARRLGMSENDTHKDSDSRKAEIESSKSDSLSKQKQGKGEWKRELASSSEAAVKADREEIDASEETIAKLQKETANAAEKAK